MPPATDFGSLTKEPPFEKLLATIAGATPGRPYNELLSFGRRHTHGDAPGLVRKRFLLLDSHNRIVYDRLLSLTTSEGVDSPLVLKVMYFVWALRDERLRRFICERIATQRGRWRIRELRNKQNAGFFLQWFEESSSRKARSNIEYFFVEAGIYRPKTRSVHLELEDGWLSVAMQVAAQHETDEARRQMMINMPGRFLVDNNWHALANATPRDLYTLDEPLPAESQPFEDEEIAIAAGEPRLGRIWTPRAPSRRTGRTTTAFVNHVLRERANMSHWFLVQLTGYAARAKGYEPYENDHIDMYFETPTGSVVAEMKSCSTKNIHGQIRRGVSQLLEYQFIYTDRLTHPLTLLLVLELRPYGPKQWLVDYLDSLGIVLAWKDPGQERLVTSATVTTSLDGVVCRSE